LVRLSLLANTRQKDTQTHYLLIREAMRDPEGGIGKPEALRENLSGLWSRRIDDVNRLVYATEKYQLVIIACRYHYE
jgi:toxin YoeB